MSGLSVFFLTTGNILFRSMPNGNYLFNSASLSLVGDNYLAHKLRVMAAVELHLNATYAQHLALKSVYEKRHNKSLVVSCFSLGQCLS